MKEFLSRAGVAFIVRNVDEDGGAYDELLARGWQTVPMTIVGDRIVRGYDAPALQQALDARRP